MASGTARTRGVSEAQRAAGSAPARTDPERGWRVARIGVYFCVLAELHRESPVG